MAIQSRRRREKNLPVGGGDKATSFCLSRRSIKAGARSAMPAWQDRIFMILTRNADDASTYFRIPTDRVVEIGTQVTV
jgi:KUP system potassium uptake protein